MNLENLLFPNRYRRKLFAILWLQPGRWTHLRELARLAQASAGTLKKELDLLCSVGLIEQRKMGNQTQFCVNTQHPTYPELSGLVKKTIGLKDVLANALQPVASNIEVAFVFGSIAQATEGAASDVDLMVIGQSTFGEVANALYEAQTSLAREINPKVMTREEWVTKKIAGQPFVQDVLTKPKLFILGAEHEL